MIQDTFPALIDVSRNGRGRFLDEWEDQLWAYWEEQLSVLIVGGSIDPAAALGRAWDGPEHEARRMIADRMVQALRERPTLDRVKPWTDVRGWYAWLVGSRAMNVDRHREDPLDEDHLEATVAKEHGSEGLEPNSNLDDVRAAVSALVDEWASILQQIITGTGIAAIERDWLWATCAARRPLARYLGEVGIRAAAGAADFIAHSRKALARYTSTPGSSRAERTERTRCGAAACFRFNLAAWAPAHTELAPASRVFLGPADVRPPYRPRAAVESEAVEGFRHLLRLAAVRDGQARAEVVEHLRARVAECALRSAVARLLPRSAELQLLRDWDELVTRVRPT